LDASVCVRMSSASIVASSCVRVWTALAFWLVNKSNYVRSSFEVASAIIKLPPSRWDGVSRSSQINDRSSA